MTQNHARVFTLLLSFCLSGCAGLTAVSAIPGAMYGMVANQFSGEEESFAYNMDLTLAATQQALLEMQIDIDILEIQDNGGYSIAFNNNKLEGKITLSKQTPRLTTVYARVRSTTREESVERAIIQMITAELKKPSRSAHFHKNQFHNLRAKPDIRSRRLGWYRPGARLAAHISTTKGWLKVKMPSGKMAYLKGKIKSSKRTTPLKNGVIT